MTRRSLLAASGHFLLAAHTDPRRPRSRTHGRRFTVTVARITCALAPPPYRVQDGNTAEPSALRFL